MKKYQCSCGKQNNIKNVFCSKCGTPNDNLTDDIILGDLRERIEGRKNATNY